MDRRRERDKLGQLLHLQKLQGGLEEQRLIVRHAELLSAQHDAQAHEAQLQGSEHHLENLLNGSRFCPDAFALASACIVLDEQTLADSREKTADANTREADQRIIWHQACRKEDWLKTKTNRLTRKVTQIQEDKTTLQVAATQWLTSERGV